MSVDITTDALFEACFRVATGGERDGAWAHISSLQRAVASVGINAPRKLQVAARKASKGGKVSKALVIALDNGDEVVASDSPEGLNLTLRRGDAYLRLRIVFYHFRFVATIREVAGDVGILMDVVMHFASARKEILRGLGEKPSRRTKPRLTVVCNSAAA